MEQTLGPMTPSSAQSVRERAYNERSRTTNDTQRHGSNILLTIRYSDKSMAGKWPS